MPDVPIKLWQALALFAGALALVVIGLLAIEAERPPQPPPAVTEEPGDPGPGEPAPVQSGREMPEPDWYAPDQSHNPMNGTVPAMQYNDPFCDNKLNAASPYCP